MRSFLLFMACLPGIAFSQPTRLPDHLDAIIRQGIDALMEERFMAADSLFRMAAGTYADHPVGPVMQAALVHLVAEDRLEPVDAEIIDSLHAVAEERGRAFSLDTREGRIALAFVSSSRGVVSLEAARKGAWLKAIDYALRASALGEDILEADSAIADAGLVVGNYYYWKSRRVEVLTWLPFVADSRQEGIYLLRQCASSGAYQRYAAMNSLGWILRDAKEGIEGRRWIEAALHEYPENRPLLRSYAALLQDAGLDEQARSAWTTIRSTLERDGQGKGWAAYEAVVMEAELSRRMRELSRMHELMQSAAALERTLDRSVRTDRRESLLEKMITLRSSAAVVDPLGAK